MVKKQGAKRRPWNKGLEVGKKGAFTPAQVKRIRQVLMAHGASGLRDLALFQVAITPCCMGRTHSISQSRKFSFPTVKFVQLSKSRAGAECSRSDAPFPKRQPAHLENGSPCLARSVQITFSQAGVTGSRRPIGVRHMNRLLKFWIAEAGFDPKKYGNESLRRTKALHILKGTGDLETVRMLLAHAKIESTARFLRVPTTSDPIPISRAFDI